MFWHRENYGPIEFAITDARTDLGRDSGAPALATLCAAFGTERIVGMRQVHGAHVARATPGLWPEADALILAEAELGALVRVADCTPVVVAAPDQRLLAVVHAGREGMVKHVVPAAVQALRERGAADVHAWLGPRACGACYELPAQMVDDIAGREPAARSRTRWGTDAIDVGAGIVAQLQDLDVGVTDLGSGLCTIEDSNFHSHRRQGAAAGRFGIIATIRGGR